MTDAIPPAASSAGPAAPVRGPRPVWGLPLVAPALLLWLFGLVPPVLSTLYLSLTRTNSITGHGAFVGVENYGKLFDDDAYGRAAGFTLLVVVVRVVAVAVVPPLLAWGAVALRRWTAVPAVAFAVPLAFATPAFAAMAYRMRSGPGALVTAGSARGTVLGTGGVYALLYACGLGLVVLTAALRAETRPGRTGMLGRPFLTAWTVGLLAAGAYGLQAFTGVSLLTNGGPGRATTTLGLHAFAEGFMGFDMGYAAAVGVTFLLPVMVLGLCAGLLVITGGLGFDPRPDAGTPRPVRGAATWVAGGIALLVALVVLVRGLAPVVAGWSGPPVRGVGTGGAVLRVLLHDAPSTVLVVVVALAAAIGIVVFRPFGRGGAWLLLPFAPWLFVTAVAQAPALFLAYTRGTVQRPFAHLQPALGLLPILVVAFVILLRGVEPRWRAARARREPLAFARHVLTPGWPAVLGVSAGAFLAVTHEYVTAWATVTDAGDQPLPVAVARATQGVLAHGSAVTRPDLPLAVLPFAVVAAVAAWYAGRAVLRETPPG